jgi:hypothetical protein
MMRLVVSGLLGLALLGGSAQVYAVKCGDNPGDEAAVAAALAQQTEVCCARATNHGQYLSCVGVGLPHILLPAYCTGAVMKCAGHSTCGKPGFVTCCLTTSKGPKCKLKKDAATCTKKGGTPTVDPLNTSCCSTTHPLTETACMASPSGAFLDVPTL